jgi:transcriptional regulator with XRE-family HTH domain
MNTAMPVRPVGELLRDWRQRRRLSQLDLALDVSVSARHLSFVETGRARPSRELLLDLAEQLALPLRDRNVLLLVGGYAPAYRETPLDAEAMAPVREALAQILGGHEPYPAVMVDRGWRLVAANGAVGRVLTAGVAPELLAPPANALRITLHPDGMAPRIANFGAYSAHLMERLERVAARTGDPSLRELYAELAGYPGVVTGSGGPPDPAAQLFVPLRLRLPDREGELTFFSTIAIFGTALDITLEELAIESFFPADAPTAAFLRESGGAPPRQQASEPPPERDPRPRHVGAGLPRAR